MGSFFAAFSERSKSRAKRVGFCYEDVHQFLQALCDGEVHAERVYSLADATGGVMSRVSLTTHAIGQALAPVRGKLAKHAVTRVDRLLANAGVEVRSLFAYRAPNVAGGRWWIVAAMVDGNRRRRARHAAHPADVDEATRKAYRNACEDRMLWGLREMIPEVVRVLIQARTLIHYHAKRWSIKGNGRDTEDLIFAMGTSAAVHISNPVWRDWPWLLNTFAVVLLTWSGTAGEASGYDRHLKADTIKRRTRSLLRQGRMHYDSIPAIPEERLRSLIQRFAEMLIEHRNFSDSSSPVQMAELPTDQTVKKIRLATT